MRTRIEKVRKSLCLTRKEMGERLGFSENYVYLMESGKKPISDKYVRSMVKEVGANENWIRTGDGDMFMPSTREEEIASIAASVFKEDSLFRTMLIKELCDAPAECLEQIHSYVKYVVDMYKKNEQE